MVSVHSDAVLPALTFDQVTRVLMNLPVLLLLLRRLRAASSHFDRLNTGGGGIYNYMLSTVPAKIAHMTHHKGCRVDKHGRPGLQVLR